MFVPTLAIKRFTVKWTMAASMLAYSAYIAGQFYPGKAAPIVEWLLVTHLDNGSPIPRRSQYTKLYNWYGSVPGYMLGCSARIVTCE